MTPASIHTGVAKRISHSAISAADSANVIPTFPLVTRDGSRKSVTKNHLNSLTMGEPQTSIPSGSVVGTSRRGGAAQPGEEG